MRTRGGVVLAALVAVSASVHALAGRRITTLWILPDEGVYAQRALDLFHHGRLPVLRGSGAGYSTLYPILLGAPLSIGHLHTGYDLARIGQAVVVSLAAVPVYLYARRLVAGWLALAAAALTVASPLLLYSGLLMTEVLFYPLAGWTLLAIARALGTGTRRDVLLAAVLLVACVLTRDQAVVFVPVFALGALLDALFSRSTARLRFFWPLAALAVAGVVVAALRPGVLGSYAETVRGGYPFGAAVKLSLEQLALAVLTTAVLPAAALCALLVDGMRARLPDPQLRSLVATAVAAMLLVPVEVGVFGTRFAPHLLERDLAALPPLLFVVFAAWLGRGLERPFAATVAIVLALGTLLLLTPWNALVNIRALPDSFSVMILYRFQRHNPATLVAIAVLVLLALFIFASRRLAPVLVVVPFALLVTASAFASNTIAGIDGQVRRDLVGSQPDWIDRSADGSTAYFYDGETYWTVVWEERFWNRRLDQIVTPAGSPVPGPIAQTPTSIGADGRLPIHGRFAVATDFHYFVGTPIARLNETDIDVAGLTLWHLVGPPRLSFELRGFQPNGDITHPAKIRVFDCGGGKLELTILTKATHRLVIRRDGRTVVDVNVRPDDVWQGSIPGRPGRGECVYQIVPRPLLGSTSIDFVR